MSQSEKIASCVASVVDAVQRGITIHKYTVCEGMRIESLRVNGYKLKLMISLLFLLLNWPTKC